MLQGSLVALITPMNQDGSIHYEQLRDLIDWHIENGTDGIVAVGTTGESATLSVEEHTAVIEAVVKHVAKRVPGHRRHRGKQHRRKPSPFPKPPKKPVQTSLSPSSPITTSPPKKAFTNISKPSPKPLRFR
uniref:Dihydrodipicolinate synthase n=1 Tax=Neisseria meningitidis alpha275 TaxID=295996 RepID=C6SHN2_NEIME|nr:dihydrodipicolinate synthase [Neisseria meningitidis alpha275]